MNSVFNAPVQWSKKAVGPSSRFIALISLHIGGVLLLGWHSSWHLMGFLFLLGLMLPVCYLFALRGVVRELLRLQAGRERDQSG